MSIVFSAKIVQSVVLDLLMKLFVSGISSTKTLPVNELITCFQLCLDIDELKAIISQATRQRVKDLLSLDIRKLETEQIKLQEQIQKEVAKSKPTSSASSPVVTGAGRCYDVKIMNYGESISSVQVS